VRRTAGFPQCEAAKHRYPGTASVPVNADIKELEVILVRIEDGLTV
jgi:hypothetical protein